MRRKRSEVEVEFCTEAVFVYKVSWTTKNSCIS